MLPGRRNTPGLRCICGNFFRVLPGVIALFPPPLPMSPSFLAELARLYEGVWKTDD